MKRIAVSVFVLWLVATLSFLIFLGRDPFAGIWWELDPETRKMVLETLGTNERVLFRYVHHLRKMFTFGLVYPYFGWSVLDKGYISYGLTHRLPVTLFLVGASLVGSIVLGIIMGTLAAAKQRTKRDALFTASSLLTWGTPVFVVQFMVVYVLSYLLVYHGIYIFPLNASLPIPRPTGVALYVAIAWHMTLPIITLTLAGLGPWVIYTRNLLVDSLTQDYIVTARAKGLKERTVIFRHAFRTILPPVATMMTLAIPTIITGSIITETVFGIRGIGNYWCRAFVVEGRIVRVLDIPVIQAVFFIYATIAVFLNLMADLMYGILDPRIRTGTRR